MGMANKHLGAYFGSIAASQTNLSVNAVQDGILTILNNHFIVPQAANILWALVTGTSVSRGRLNTPKFRYIGLPSLVPTNILATIASPPNVYDGRDYPMQLDPVDEIAFEVSTDASGTANVFAAMLFSFGNLAVTPGPTYRLRATAAITGATGTWANGALTFDNTLPSGHYQIVGMDVVGANLLFARLIIPGAAFRPGVFARNAVSSWKHPINEPGSVGVIGDFDSINVPNLEILCSGANSAQEVFLDVQLKGPIGSGK